MKSNRIRNCCIALLAQSTILASTVIAAETNKLDEALEPLRPFIGRTWRGEFKHASPDKRTIDVARWERALNGKGIRVLHSINDGSYGGESIIHWDREKKEIRYHYFSTAGFNNTGTMSVSNNVLTAVEKVSGNGNGVTEVRSTYELRKDGTMLNRSQYLKNGAPTGDREVLYKEDASAEVKFK